MTRLVIIGLEVRHNTVDSTLFEYSQNTFTLKMGLIAFTLTVVIGLLLFLSWTDVLPWPVVAKIIAKFTEIMIQFF